MAEEARAEGQAEAQPQGQQAGQVEAKEAQGAQPQQGQARQDGQQAQRVEGQAKAQGKKRVVVWDKGIDYIATYQQLLRALSREKRVNGKCYAAIALIVLRNGLRGSEGIEAFKAAMKTGAEIVDVLTRKKKRPSYRKAKIPEPVRQVIPQCRHMLAIGDQLLLWRFNKWLRSRFKLNPHSLRYSFITHAVMAGLDSALVAKAINHARVEQLEAYIQRKAAIKHVLENDIFDI